MKRDLDLIRDILIFAENMEYNNQYFKSEKYNDFVCGEHVYLLAEAGFLEMPKNVQGMNMIHPIITRLTWEGHEFLATIRNEEVFNKSKIKYLYFKTSQYHLSVNSVFPL